MSRRLIPAVIVVAVVAALVAVPLPATASTSGLPTFDPPSPKSPRAYLINVLGKVLGPAAPTAWQRENIANANRFNWGWETLDAQLGGNVMNGNYLKQPGTIEEYRVLQAEQNWGRAAVGTGADRRNVRETRRDNIGGPFAAPATRAQKFGKVIGGAAAAVTGAAIGFQVGQNVSEFFGLDVTTGLCSPTFEDFGLIALMTGADCTPTLLDPNYTPNGDYVPGWTGTACTVSGVCITFQGYAVNSAGNYLHCYAGADSGNVTSWKVSQVSDMPAGGSYSSLSSSTPCAAQFPGSRVAGFTPAAQPDDLLEAFLFSRTGDPSAGPVLVKEAEEDPLRELTCSVLGTDGVTYTATSEPYRESEGALASPECPVLPPGVYPANVAVSDGTDVLYNEPATDEFLELVTEFAECMTGSCVQDLIHIPTGKSCAADDMLEVCRDWFDDPNRSEKYQCTLAGRNVEIQNCFIYAGLFKPERIAAGAPYSDPLTGHWSGGKNAPDPSTVVLGSGVLDPDAPRSCFPTGWQVLNPVEWVMQPVQCALQWAFVPRPAVVEVEVARSENAWNETPLGTIPAAVSGWGLDATLTGCEGPPVDTGMFLPGEGGEVVYPMSACAGPSATWATVSTIALGLTFSVLGVLAIIRQWGGVVGQRGIGAQA